MFEQIAGNEESLTVVCLSIVGIVAMLIFGVGWTLVSLAKVLAHSRLKQQMLGQGMSPSEIEQVLKAGSDEFKNKWHQTRNPPVRGSNLRSSAPSKPHA